MKEWVCFLDEQEKTHGTDAIQRWARTLKVVHFDAGNLYLEAADPFQLHWFEQYLRPLIKNSFRSMSGRPIRVHLTLAAPAAPVSPKKEWKPPVDLTPNSLLSNCVFETYFPGTTNNPNLNLLQETVTKKSFNPLYLQGPAGVGKTHLLMAACHLLKKEGRSVFYVNADRFTQHIVAAIRSGVMPALRELYRKHDTLVIDAVEALADRSASQEELFHTFNTLHLAGKQILLAGRTLPSELKGIEPRLTSRFEWGLVLSFKPLSKNELNEYFVHLLARKKIALEPLLIEETLSFFSTIALLNRATDILEVKVKEMAPTLSLLHKWFSTLIQEQQRKLLTPQAILQAVASHFDIPLSDLQGRSQTQEHATPRQIAMYLCRSQLHIPYMKIGELFSRDHSTVMTSVKLITQRLQDSPLTQGAVKAILDLLRN